MIETVCALCQPLLVYFKPLLPIFVYSNEFVFMIQNVVIASFALMASRFGKMGLTAFIALTWILANFLVQKEVLLFGNEVITSDGLTIGLNCALLLLSYYYGQKVARQAISISGFLILFFLILSQIHLWYIPSSHDVSNLHYIRLFEGLPRILCTSLFVSSMSSYLNLILHTLFSRVFSFLPLAFTNIASLAVSQVIDTILFAFLALYGTVSSITSIIIFSSCVKFVAIGLNVLLMTVVQRYFSKPYDVA